MVSVGWGFSNLFQPQLSLLSSILEILTWLSINISNIYKAKWLDCISMSLSTVNLLLMYLSSSLKTETPFFQVFEPKTLVLCLAILSLLHPAFNLLSNAANPTINISAESDHFSFCTWLKSLNWSPCFQSISCDLFPTWKLEWPFYYSSHTFHPST